MRGCHEEPCCHEDDKMLNNYSAPPIGHNCWLGVWIPVVANHHPAMIHLCDVLHDRGGLGLIGAQFSTSTANCPYCALPGSPCH